MKIKVCGLRERENIEALKLLPIDFMGFIFYAASKRDVSNTKGLSKLLADQNWQSSIKKVGVFVNAEIGELLHRVHDYHLDFVQLHGEESPEYCQELQHFWSISNLRKARIIKVFSIATESDFEQFSKYEPFCQFFLFDTKGEQRGGNGVQFDWNLLTNYKGMIPFLLSGGIGAEDQEAVRQINIPQFYGIDVNSKFEIAPANKDVEKLKQFTQQLKY